MKRHAGPRWTVNWVGDDAPAAGQLVRRVVGETVRGYYRVDDVRLVRNRKPLPEGCNARYTVLVTFISDTRPGPVDWTCHWKRRPRRPPDRFSPLL
ncbi:hypothetical protein [Pseudoxanthomonas sp. SE1]|uniref:hypothetical protein n=1 Tax=Pseudoxanthomonas sp. SE1 TaxID=1664560 RepID=UPI00240E2174|nr:hypothetical protein [Pseudoxanthomonas sp. SE1]WFC43191.1 hypothetical protein OY559_06690 [Pseudoxanthomonas sp. SE1]